MGISNPQISCSLRNLQLVGITASAAAVGSRNLGYCAPEVTETHRLTFMSDVYSFGVVCLLHYGTFFPSYYLLVFFVVTAL
jgi:serine/threonine protein kinase